MEIEQLIKHFDLNILFIYLLQMIKPDKTFKITFQSNEIYG